jgi:probable HAF family extracellular repeat protein
MTPYPCRRAQVLIDSISPGESAVNAKEPRPAFMSISSASRIRTPTLLWASSLALLALSTAHASPLHQIKYTFTTIISPGKTYRSLTATALDSRGDVVGRYTPDRGPAHAFLFEEGRFIDLGALKPGYMSSALAVNSSRTVVGVSGYTGPDPKAVAHGFVYSGGRMKDIGTLGGASATPLSINRNGTIVGDSDNNSGVQEAFAYSKGLMHPLIEGSSIAYAVNGHDDVAGGKFPRAFLFHDGRFTDLGTLGGPNPTSEAFAINDAEQVVGISCSYSPPRATCRGFIYTHHMQDLGTLGGSQTFARAINSAGDVVGWSDTSGGQQHAFVRISKTMYDLNSLVEGLPKGVTLNDAVSINDRGQVLIPSVSTRTRGAVAYVLTRTGSR